MFAKTFGCLAALAALVGVFSQPVQAAPVAPATTTATATSPLPAFLWIDGVLTNVTGQVTVDYDDGHVYLCQVAIGQLGADGGIYGDSGLIGFILPVN